MKIFIPVIIVVLFLSGCATVLKGTMDEVQLMHYSPDMVIKDKYGLQLTVQQIDLVRSNRSANPYDNVQAKVDTFGRKYFILLDSSERQVLTVERADRSRVVVPYRHIGISWLFLDTIFLFYPAFIDASTGAWYQFAPIDVAL